MTLHPAAPEDDALDRMIDVAANAHVAGVCGSLLRERLEAHCQADGAAGLAASVLPEDLADIASAVLRIETATVRILGRLEPEARLSATTVVAAARDMAHASLAETLRPAAGEQGQQRRGAAR
jgi:hypothetical protein